MTDQSERLVPRYSDANTLTMAEKAARHIAKKQDYEWDNLDEAWQKDRIQQALSFLEAAGVERLRAELASTLELLRLAKEYGTAKLGDAQSLSDALDAAEKDRDEQKARADRAEGQRNWAADRIAALEYVVDAARVMLKYYGDRNDPKVERLVDALAALDSAQPAPDAPGSAFTKVSVELLKSLEEQARKGSELDAKDEQIRELEAELHDATGALQSVPHIQACRRDAEVDRDRWARAHSEQAHQVSQLEERIRVACAELRRMSASVHEMGYHSTAADLSRIARALEGNDSANIDSGQPAGTPSTGPGQSLGGQEPAGCPSPLPVSTELLARLCRAKSVDIIIRKDGVERRFQADWLKTMARAQKDSGQPAGTGVPQGAREGHSSSGGLRSEMQAEAQLQHAKETRAQEETPAGCSSPAHETPWRVGSQVPQNVYDAKDRPVAQFHDNGTAMRVVEAVNRNELDADYWREAKADLRMLCIIAAQFETTQPQMQPLSEKLNGPERNAGPEYAIRLVERMRGRLEKR